MQESENIIAVRSRDINEAHKAFAELMGLSESLINEKAKQQPNHFKEINSSTLETITEKIIQEVCPATPFRKEDIKLISGQSFPDILVTDFYGVEVKSTKGNSWKSTGSSIVESTRSPLVERIYLMFGKLGSTPPTFRCKPYSQCLYDIAVTHAPRYLIDMETPLQETIFSKINFEYDEFQVLPEYKKIEIVRNFYKTKAQTANKKSIPWWMGDSTNVMLSFYGDLSISQKDELRIRALILFPSLYETDASNAYKDIALWLCNRYSILNNNLRDLFSSGGKVKFINNTELKKPFPAIVKRLLTYNKQIKELLQNPDSMLIEDIKEYGALKTGKHQSLYTQWLNMLSTQFKKNPNLEFVPIKKLMLEEANPR